MENKRFRIFYVFSVIGVFILSAYPLYMAQKVVEMMVTFGSVPTGQFPKYIIPYSPIAFALLCGTLLMPLFLAYAKRYAFPAASVSSLGVFLISELLLESKVVVSSTTLIPLEGWQMYMCYVPPMEYETRTWTAIDVLMGEYSPSFKIHFYLISAVLIISVLNVLYGFGTMIRTGDKKRKSPLILQGVCAAAFLGMCILACFTAFYRTGELTVSPLSAWLMAIFFILLGVSVGIFAASFTVAKRKLFSVILPSVLASVTVLLMYVGEACLLSGHLYVLGKGVFFEPLVGNFVSLADVCIILAGGIVTAAISLAVNGKKNA